MKVFVVLLKLLSRWKPCWSQQPQQHLLIHWAEAPGRGQTNWGQSPKDSAQISKGRGLNSQGQVTMLSRGQGDSTSQHGDEKDEPESDAGLSLHYVPEADFFCASPHPTAPRGPRHSPQHLSKWLMVNTEIECCEMWLWVNLNLVDKLLTCLHLKSNYLSVLVHIPVVGPNDIK